MTREEDAVRRQARSCHRLGSPLYGSLLARCAASEDGGILLSLLRSRPAAENLVAEAVVLRLLATMHGLALDGRAPALAAAYPSCGGTGSLYSAWPAFVATLEAHRPAIECELGLPVQTNEIGRAAALLGGFLALAQLGAPLRLLEIGASAGLLLRWDHVRYEADAWSWGPLDAAVRLTDHFRTGGLPFRSDASVSVVARAGCDVSPIDATGDAGRRRLVSFVWPDQSERIARLTAACDLARLVPAPVERADAAEWLERKLRTSSPGLTTVVYHTVFLQYLTIRDRRRLARTLDEAGSRATRRAPLAYLSLEPRHDGKPNVMLQTWPGAERYGIAHATMHGREVAWRGPASVARRPA